MTPAGLQRIARCLTVCTLVTSLSVRPGLPAQTHVVSSDELQAAVLAATQSRLKHREAILSFLGTPKAEKTLRAAHIDMNLVKSAVASLDDEELARLAARAADAQKDFAAGRLTDRDLILILIGIAALILIIVAVD